MEPLSALSVAAAVVQFVDFAGRIIGSAFELRDSMTGELARNFELDEVTTDLKARAQEISTIDSQNPDVAFGPLAQRALTLSEELLAVLSDLKRKHSGSFKSWAALQAAIRNFLKAGKIESLQGRLDNVRSEMMLKVNVALWHKHAHVEDLLQTMDQKCESMQLTLSAQTLQLQQAVHVEMTRQRVELADLVRAANNSSKYKKLVQTVQDQATESRKGDLDDCARRFGSLTAKTEQMVIEADYSSHVLQFLQSLCFKEMPRRKDRIARSYRLDDRYRGPEKYRGEMGLKEVAGVEEGQGESWVSKEDGDSGNGSVWKDEGIPVIPDALRQTYSWIFDPKKSGFPRWLSRYSSRTSDGIFWLTGKAGSGKSTLMKFIDDERRTRRGLGEWMRSRQLDLQHHRKARSADAASSELPATSDDSRTRPLELVTASFFFWNAGTSLQKSQQGLLQSLCFQIFAARPDLAPEVCPERWSASRQSRLEPPEWTSEELEKVLFQVLDRASSRTMFCFFIDGLDEYEGEDPYTLVSLINRLANYVFVKFCVSSRPWNVFRKEYGKISSLVLEDHTKSDMTVYIYGKLESDARFQRLAERESRAQELANEVSERAHGVFFWVYLVVHDLLRGMNEDDDFETLQKRLRALPTGLEEYFEHMLRRLERVYQERTAQALLVGLTALNPVSALVIYCLEHDQSLKGFLRLAMIQASHPEQYDFVRSTVISLTNKWCRDLRCVTNDEPFGYFEFLHRTVKDFLNSESIYRLLRERAGSSFNIRTILCRTFLAQLSCAKHGRTDVFASLSEREMVSYARQIMFFAKESETYEGKCLSGELEELERLDGVLPLKTHNYHLSAALSTLPVDADFFAWIVSCDLRLYVDFALQKQPDLLIRPGAPSPLIDFAFFNGLDEFPGTSRDHEDMVKLLIKHAVIYDKAEMARAKRKSFRARFRTNFGPGPAAQEFMRGKYPTRYVADR